MNVQNESRNSIMNIIGMNTDLSNEEIIHTLMHLQVNYLTHLIIKEHERKNGDILKKYLEDIKFLNNDNSEIYKQNREKTFYSYLKLDNKTRGFNTVINDNLTPTMHAYYFCDKSRQILTDKEAAAIKAINIDNNFDMDDDKTNNNKRRNNLLNSANKEDCEMDSNESSSENNQNNKLNTPKLKKKRKYSIKMNKRIHKKMKYKNNNDDCYFNPGNNMGDDEEEDKEYCIHNCLSGRKYQKGNDMIGCDGCENWYHPKCINMTDEEFQKNTKIEWHCFNCKTKKKV